jgi:hypothetical protein
MRLSLWVSALIGIVLILAGLRPDALPFMPDSLFSDAAVSHYPAAYHLQQSVRAGEFPVWQELNMAGQPFAANPLNKTAYPLQWLAVVLPAALHLNVMIVFHIAIAAWGMWRWVRALGLRAEAAAVGALAYALAPRALGHLGAGHLDLLYALAWFPHLMWATWRVCLSAFRLQCALTLGLFAALVLLADVRLSLFAFISAAAYGVWLCASARHWRSALTGAVALVPFGVLTAALIIPLALWSPYLSRAALTAQEAGAFSLSLVNLLGILLPLPAGDVEMLTYGGSATLVLALVALLTAPRLHRFWLGLLLFALLYALGTNTPFWTTLANTVPALRWFRVPARAWFIVALVMPLLAAYGTQRLMAWSEGAGIAARRQLPVAKLLLIVYLLVVTLFGGFAVVSNNAATAGGLIFLISGYGIAIVLWFTLSGRLKSQMLTIALMLIVTFDLGANGLRWLEWRGREDWFTPYVALAEYLHDDGADRIYSPTYSLPQQVAVEYDLHLFGGVDPFQLSRTADAIELASGVGDHGYSVVQPPQPAELGGTSDDLSEANRAAMPDVTLLAAWQVSHIVAPYPLDDPQLEEIAQIDGIVVYRNLAYRQTLSLDSVPRWLPSDELPMREVVTRNNALTVQAAAFSAVASVCVVVSILVLEARRK